MTDHRKTPLRRGIVTALAGALAQYLCFGTTLAAPPAPVAETATVKGAFAADDAVEHEAATSSAADSASKKRYSP